MNFVIDAIILIVFVLILWTAARRGFIKSFMALVSTVASGIVAYAFTPSLANIINERFMLDRISGDISTTLQGFSLDVGAGSGLFNLDKLAEAILGENAPQDLMSMLNRYGTKINEFVDQIRGLTGVSKDTVDGVADSVAGKTSLSLSSIIAFVLIFIGAFIVLKLITAILNGIFKAPVLSTANKIFGFLLGVIEGALVAWLLCIVLVALMNNLRVVAPGVFGSFNLQDTFICKFLYEHNLLSMIIKLLA
ncbi:MAG: CvpA family protein [Clostridia bacterium]|nr:CvpA family protein [Clostridia bacterium]